MRGGGALRLGPGKCCRFIALKAAAAVLQRFVLSIKHIGKNPRFDRALHNGLIYLKDIRQTRLYVSLSKMRLFGFLIQYETFWFSYPI